MKRYIFFIAAALLAAVSCSKIYDATPINTDQAIGFGTWTDHLTKARAITDDEFKSGDKFNVFGSKNPTGTPSVVFNGDEVSYDGTNWTYSPPRFWDPTATSYVFYAISPSALLPSMTDAQKTTAATTGAFSTTELTFDGSVANDVLIADETPVAQTAYNAPVHLVFNHVASLLDLKIKKSFALKDATVAITAISIENIINKGTYSVSAYDGSTHKPTVAIANWTPAASSNTSSFTGSTGTVGQYGYADVTGEAIAGTNFYAFQNFIVMPQTLVAAGGSNPQQIKISYTITTTVGEVITHTDKTVAFVAFDTVDNKANDDTAAAAGWNPNTHYIYTLTLDANKIEFTAEIEDWNSTLVNGYYNLIQ